MKSASTRSTVAPLETCLLTSEAASRLSMPEAWKEVVAEAATMSDLMRCGLARAAATTPGDPARIDAESSSPSALHSAMHSAMHSAIWMLGRGRPAGRGDDPKDISFTPLSRFSHHQDSSTRAAPK